MSYLFCFYSCLNKICDMRIAIKTLLTVWLAVQTSATFSQNFARFAFTSSAGMNQMWTAVNPGAGFSWNNNISFTPHYLFTMEAELERGQVNGKVLVYGDNNFSTTASFNTAYTYKGAIAGINLLKLVAPKKRNFRIIPYIYAGAGFLSFNAERFGEDGSFQKRYESSAYTTKVGMRLKIKINNQFDIVANFERNSPQSFYLDASPIPKGYDRFTSAKLGVSYKIGTNKRHSHIDWNARASRKCNAWFDYAGRERK